MRCSQCPFFGGEVPEEVCAGCSRPVGLRWAAAVGVLLVTYWLAGHTLAYFLEGTFGYGRPAHILSLPADYRFPVSLAEHPAYGVSLGLLYGVAATVAALAASMGGLALGVALALVAGVSFPHPYYFLVLVGGAVVAGARWGGPRWWWRRLLAGVSVGLAVVVWVHVAGAAAAAQAVYLVPAVVAVAVSAGLVGLWWREVRWRSLRSGPVVLATVAAVAASPVLFSLTVTFPYHRYRVLWGKYSVEAGLLPSGEPDVGEFDRWRGRSALLFGEFARRYPGSPFAAEALSQQARLLNARLVFDPQGQAHLYEDRPSPAALPIYERTIKLYPDSVAAVRARLERAAGALRSGRFQEARQRYRDILTTYETHFPPDYQPPDPLILAGVCRQAGSGRRFSPTEKQVAYYEAYQAARGALAFLSANSQFEAEPLRLFAALDPLAPDYRQRLRELLLLYPQEVYPELGLLEDIHLALARGRPDEADRIEALLRRYPQGDLRGRSLYRLAQLAFERGQREVAEGYLRRLLRQAEGTAGGALEAAWARALLRRGLAGLERWPQPLPPQLAGRLDTVAHPRLP